MKISEAKKILYKSLLSNVTPLLIGAPGIGKTSIAKQLYEENKNLYSSLIVIEACLVNPGDLYVCVPENGTIKEYVYNIPDNSFIIIDDITLAELYQMKFLLKIVFEKRIGNKPLNCHVVMTGNYTDDLTDANVLISTMQNRILQIDVEADVDDWLYWAYENNINRNIIEFIKMDGSRLFSKPVSGPFPTPRSWEMLSKILNNIEDLNEYNIYNIAKGLVGQETAALFDEFIKYRIDFNPEKALKEGHIGKSNFKNINNDFNDNICMYSRILYLCDYIVKNIKEKGGLPKIMYKGIEKIWSNELVGEYKALFIRSLIKKDRTGIDISVPLHLVNNVDKSIMDINQELEKYKDVVGGA